MSDWKFYKYIGDGFIAIFATDGQKEMWKPDLDSPWENIGDYYTPEWQYGKSQEITPLAVLVLTGTQGPIECKE